MKITVKLQELLQQPETGILTISTLLAQKLGIIDCTDVHSVTTEQLNLIFTSIPKEWDVELKEIFDPSTLTDTFTTQLSQYINQGLGRTPKHYQDSRQQHQGMCKEVLCSEEDTLLNSALL